MLAIRKLAPNGVLGEHFHEFPVPKESALATVYRLPHGRQRHQTGPVGLPLSPEHRSEKRRDAKNKVNSIAANPHPESDTMRALTVALIDWVTSATYGRSRHGGRNAVPGRGRTCSRTGL